jgi:ketoreductase RED2
MTAEPQGESELTGKVALVTGSSSGIGAETARLLGSVGATVVVNSHSSVEAGEKLASELPGGSYVQADISIESEARFLVDETIRRHGRLDILVNNAATTVVIPFAELEAATPEIWRRLFDLNVIGTWQLTVAAVPHLREHGDGAVVNVSSIAGHRPTGSSIPYAASKAAVSHLTTLLASTLGPQIRVNAVAPGLIDTPWTEEWAVQMSYVESVAPLGRTGSPLDVAEVILGLVRARYVTGQIVLVDGGLGLR